MSTIVGRPVSSSWRNFFLVAALYDLILGAVFVVAGEPILTAIGMTLPPHIAYIQLAAVFIFVQGLSYWFVYRDPLAHPPDARRADRRPAHHATRQAAGGRERHRPGPHLGAGGRDPRRTAAGRRCPGGRRAAGAGGAGRPPRAAAAARPAPPSPGPARGPPMTGGGWGGVEDPPSVIVAGHICLDIIPRLP